MYNRLSLDKLMQKLSYTRSGFLPCITIQDDISLFLFYSRPCASVTMCTCSYMLADTMPGKEGISLHLPSVASRDAILRSISLHSSLDGPRRA